MALACWGFGLYGHSVYLAELQRLHGWPPSLIAGASTATYLLNACLVIFTSNALARFGARRFVLFGVAALATAIVLLALAREPWQVYAAYLAMSFGWLGLGLVTIPTIISQWFTRRRGLAISLALNGASFGGIVVAPALVGLIAFTGFTDAMLIAAAVMVAILVPAVLLWVPSQAATPVPPVSAAPAWTRRDALTSLPFWTVSGPFALALVAQVAFIVHQIAFMEPIVGRAQAALSVSVMTTFAVIGRLTLGAVVDRLDPRWISSVSMFSQAIALFCMTRTGDSALLLACCAAYGFSVGNIITLPALIVQREFPPAAFGMVLGLSTALGTFAGALGPGLIGLIRAAAGDYTAALMVCVALKLAGGAFVLVRKR
ncbi:MAG: MFS transporter [Alphaproteobacteria bacterium]|nr:MAG: MFS transporter [Alphaproteobacteria bacterium]